jgi:thiamine kinase-like enzyme
MYKEIDIDYYKYIYENTIKQIEEIYNYYNIVMDNIELEVYMSPADYLICRNISYIYSAIDYAKKNIEYWYQIIENKRKIRVVTNHNKLSLDHYLKSDKPYLISWESSNIDMPIYDLISLYTNNYLDFDFTELLDIYLSKYPLTK